MLSEIRQTRKDNIAWFHLYRYLGESNTQNKRALARRGLGGGRMGSYCLMDRVSVWDDEKVLEKDSVIDSHQCIVWFTSIWMFNANELHT